MAGYYEKRLQRAAVVGAVLTADSLCSHRARMGLVREQLIIVSRGRRVTVNHACGRKDYVP